MDRPLSDPDSDDDDTYRRLGSIVLRPAITSLPSIGDDNDTDGGDSSSDTEVVFSNINWAAQESAGLLSDQELSSPGRARRQTDGTVPTGAGPLSGVNGSASQARSALRAQPAAGRPPKYELTSAITTDTSLGPNRTSGTPKRGGPPIPSPASTLRNAAPTDGDGAGAAEAGRALEDDNDDDDDPDEPYEGRGWLAGAAGRLAYVAERRRANAAATDAEQVAAAAQHAAALQQHRQQQRHQQQQQHIGAISGLAVACAAAPAGAALEQQRPREGQLEEPFSHLSLDRAEVERRILADFEEAIQAADSEPPLLASGGLSLESTVAGLGLDDLDALIARLTAGTADIHVQREPAAPAAGAAPTAGSGAGLDGGGGDNGWPWALEPLPAADSLWSDEEEETVRAAGCGRAPAGRPETGMRVATGVTVDAAAGPRPLESATATAAGPAAVVPAAAVAVAVAGPQVAGLASAGPPHLPGGPLPAKFKFFAGPGAPDAASLPAPLSATGGGGGGATSGGGPVVQDLRQSIAETAQRNRREAAAAAAAAQSQAKAAAARRRLVTADSDDSDGNGGSDNGDGGHANGSAGAARGVRPVPPAPAPPSPTAHSAAARVSLPALNPHTPQATSTVPPQSMAAAPQAAAVLTSAPQPVAASSGPSASGRPAKAHGAHVSWSDSAAETVSTVSIGGDGGGAAAVTPRSTSVGTDSVDLRPASRSVFVCTAERKAEEGERARDIRQYLKARAEAAAAAEAVAAAAAIAAAKERRWPEPPAALTERMAVLAERQAAAAAAAAAAPKPAKPQRIVATFAGGDESCGDGGQASASTLDAGANGHAGTTSPADATSPAVMAASTAGPPRAFAACSTEGDEDLLDGPPPASVSDARTERGAQMAAAGTVIPTSRVPPPPSGRAASAATNSSSTITGPSASTDRANDKGSAAVAAAATTERAAPASGVAGAAAAARPTALQLPSPTASDAAPPAVAFVSPAAAACSSAAMPPAKSPGAAAAAAAAAPSDLCRLPAWLPPSSCFTLLCTSPANLPSREVGALLEWLLRQAAATTRSGSSMQDGLPAFSVVSMRLLAVPASWPLLPPAAAAAVSLPLPSLAHAGCRRTAAAAGGGRDAARVLAVACVPRAGVDADAYSHELPAAAVADAEAAAAASRQLAAALAVMPWDAVVTQPDSANGDGAEPPPAGGRRGGRGTMGGWVSTQPGARLLFTPLRLPPHAFSHHPQSHPQAGSFGSCDVAAAAASQGEAPPPPPASGAAADTAGASTFVSVVTAGVLREPHLLRRLLERAASLGVTLRGLQVVYATEEAAAAVVAATPHRLLPYTGAAVLALSGRGDPLGRWRAQLGPPEARLACRTEPSSLHALYGEAVRHITCSYDGASAARELTALFSAAAHGPPSPSSSISPRPQAPASERAAVADGAVGAAASATICGLADCGPAEAQWLALPASGAAQQAQALWCLQRILWCGYSLRGLLLMRLPAEPSLAVSPPPSSSLPLAHGQEHATALVFELTKEEAADQLPLLLAAMPPPAAPTVVQVVVAAPQAPAAAPRSLLPPGVLRSRLAPSDVHGLPQPYVAEQLLVAAAGDAALDATDDRGGGGAAVTATAGLQLHHGEDGIAVVALQARPLHAAALLLAALTAHATAAGAAANATAPEPSSAPDRLELVACRYLRQVPSDVANGLAVLHPHHGGSVATAVPARAAQRLVISQPALLAVFHGPAAQARVARWLTAALQRLHAAPSEQSVAAAEDGDGDGAAWTALLELLHREYPPAAATAPPPVAAVSASQVTAKRALSYAFGPAHVFLDAGLHDGLHRPPLPPPPTMPEPTAVAAATAAPSSTPLFRLLAGPQRLPAVVALDFASLHRNLLPRLLKQLWREGYAIHAAATCRLAPGGTAASAMPALAGQPVVLLHVSRSNAVQHLRAMAAALAASAAAFGVGGLYTCDTWRDAVAVLAEVWPGAGGAAGTAGAAAHEAPAFIAPAGTRPARRFVRPDGSRLLQLTTMVVTPPAPSAGDAVPPSLDWPRLADALEALHAEGFRLGAVRAAAAFPRDLCDLGRASCRVSSAQQQAVQASSATAVAAATVAAAAAVAAAPPPPPCNLVLLALARDSAVTTLQVLLDEASRTAAGRGPGRREAAAALGALAPCISVAHSPAAAEQQVAAVFEGVFGKGGVALLQ